MSYSFESFTICRYKEHEKESASCSSDFSKTLDREFSTSGPEFPLSGPRSAFPRRQFTGKMAGKRRCDGRDTSRLACARLVSLRRTNTGEIGPASRGEGERERDVRSRRTCARALALARRPPRWRRSGGDVTRGVVIHGRERMASGVHPRSCCARDWELLSIVGGRRHLGQ